MWYPPVMWTLVYNPHQLVRYIYHLSTTSPTYCSYVHQLNAIPNWGTTMYTYLVIDHNNGYKTIGITMGKISWNPKWNPMKQTYHCGAMAPWIPACCFLCPDTSPQGTLLCLGVPPECRNAVPERCAGNGEFTGTFWVVFSKNGLVDEQKMVEVDVIDVTWKPGVVDKYSDIEWHWVTWDLMNTF